MDKKLSLLFDYQKFEGNVELQSVIDKVNARFSSSRRLSDDEADLVAAAGLPGTALPRKKPRDKENDLS